MDDNATSCNELIKCGSLSSRGTVCICVIAGLHVLICVHANVKI